MEGLRARDSSQPDPPAPVVLITGAGRGIGRATALRFARSGATVMVAARTREQIEEVARACDTAGGRGIAVPMDVCDPDSVKAGLALGLAASGQRLDVLVNNAGVFAVVPFRDMDYATWRHLFDVNLDGVFHVTQAALPKLLSSPRPHLINIASVAALEPFEGSSAYCATKYGLRGLTDVLRLELEPVGARVTCIYPKATDTTIFDDTPLELDPSEMDQPEEVAEVIYRAWASEGEGTLQDQ